MPTEGKAVPYDEQKGLIDEDAAGHPGEVSEFEPGKAGALRLSLKPGRYALICNVPGPSPDGAAGGRRRAEVRGSSPRA
jgi:uncharacterized cupredoxin-like copper-binding protein